MKTTTNIATAALLAVGAFFAYIPVNTAIVSGQPVSVAPVAAEQVVAGEGPVKFDSPSIKTVAAPKLTGKEDPEGWVRGIAAEAGLSFGNVRIEITSDGNCGEGCTYFSNVDRVNQTAKNPVWTKIQPRHIGTEYGKFVVLHELGHISGIVSECGADQFARNHGGNPAIHDAHC